MHADRKRGRARTRVLYWFRTPPGVRVGRAALDENAIRLIEEHNPDVAFDWTRILKGEGAAPEPKPRQEFQERRQRPRPPRESAQPSHYVPAATPPPVAAAAGVPAPHEVVARELAEPDLPAEVAFAPAPVDAFDEDGTPVGVIGGEPPEPAELPTTTAALARLGAEGLLRLRARHAEVLARITEKIQDPVKRDELKSQADRLNPDTWVTDTEVTAGLEQYESVFESLRAVVGRRRKRRRRRTPDNGQAGAANGADTADDGDAGAEDDGQDPGQDL